MRIAFNALMHNAVRRIAPKAEIRTFKAQTAIADITYEHIAIFCIA